MSNDNNDDNESYILIDPFSTTVFSGKCEWCNKGFISKGRGQPQKYCCPMHRQMAYNKKYRDKIKGYTQELTKDVSTPSIPELTLICQYPHCHKEFKAMRFLKYCSQKCRLDMEYLKIKNKSLPRYIPLEHIPTDADRLPIADDPDHDPTEDNLPIEFNWSEFKDENPISPPPAAKPIDNLTDDDIDD